MRRCSKEFHMKRARTIGITSNYPIGSSGIKSALCRFGGFKHCVTVTEVANVY